MKTLNTGKRILRPAPARGLLNTEEIVRAKIIPLHGTIAIERGNMKQKAKESAVKDTRNVKNICTLYSIHKNADR